VNHQPNPHRCRQVPAPELQEERSEFMAWLRNKSGDSHYQGDVAVIPVPSGSVQAKVGQFVVVNKAGRIAVRNAGPR